MNNKFKIIVVSDYILAVSDGEIKKGKKLIPNMWYINSYRGYDRPFKNHNLDNNGYLERVLGYQPKGNAPELDLPLLPDMVFEDNVESFVDKEFKEEFEIAQEAMPAIWYDFKLKIIKFLNAAAKVYCEEDLRKAYLAGRNNGELKTEKNFNDFIQVLKQPKKLKRFVAETTGGGEYLAGEIGGNEIWAEYPIELKTTTKNGKTYLVGTYLYE